MSHLSAGSSPFEVAVVLVVGGLYFAVIAAWFLMRSSHAADRPNVEDWARAHALTLTERNWPMIAHTYCSGSGCARSAASAV